MQVTENKTNFTYRPNPVLQGSYLICKKTEKGDLQPVGDYTLLDRNENAALTEKKVMNLITLLNGGSDLVPLGEETRSRLLFHRKPRDPDSGRSEVVFYAYTGEGVSRENAILTIEGEFNA